LSRKTIDPVQRGIARMDDESAHHAHRHLHRLVGVRVIHEGAARAQLELVDEGLARLDLRLGEAVQRRLHQRIDLGAGALRLGGAGELGDILAGFLFHVAGDGGHAAIRRELRAAGERKHRQRAGDAHNSTNHGVPHGLGATGP
jgi:hypothetical protein